MARVMIHHNKYVNGRLNLFIWQIVPLCNRYLYSVDVFPVYILTRNGIMMVVYV